MNRPTVTSLTIQLARLVGRDDIEDRGCPPRLMFALRSSEHSSPDLEESVAPESASEQWVWGLVLGIGLAERSPPDVLASTGSGPPAVRPDDSKDGSSRSLLHPSLHAVQVGLVRTREGRGCRIFVSDASTGERCAHDSDVVEPRPISRRQPGLHRLPCRQAGG